MCGLETEALTGFLLGEFGIRGFLSFKFGGASTVATVALLYGERLRKGSEATSVLYFAMSVSLAVIAA